MGVKFTYKGDFKKTEKLMHKYLQLDYTTILVKYAVRGLEALQEATPKDTGLTAMSWSYKITKKRGAYEINWNNSNVQNYVNIAIILQYGHATGNGGYVKGRDYINPALQPVFDAMAEEAWKEVEITHG